MLSSGLAMLVNDFLIPWLQFRWVHLSLPLRMGFISPTPKSRRYSCYHCEGGHVLGYDSTSSYHTTLAHGHAWEDHCVSADVGPGADPNWLNLEIRLHDRDSDWNCCVLRPEYLCPRTPADEFLNHQLAGIKVTLRPDPHAIPDLAFSVEPPLQVSSSADEDTTSKCKSFEVFESDLAAYQEAIPAAPRDGTKNCSPH